MRTNIDIDDALISQAIKLSGLPTKRAAVEAGLKLLIQTRQQASVRELFGKIPLDADLGQTRQGRRVDRRR
jgi:Arc/MetJ family transcription regulator